MTGNLVSKRFQLIVGVHDLAETPDARDDELLSWLAFSQVRPLLEQIRDNTQRTGTELHVTSDDAFRSDYELLLPWLLERGVKGTFFIPTRFVDLPGRLTSAQIREIAGLGIRIGVHGARHIDWSRASAKDFMDDVTEGRDRLQDLLGNSVDLVAPPFGGYDGRIVESLLQLGFQEIHTCRSGLALRSEALKPRNMLKQSQIEAVLATSRLPGGLADAARCRLRRVRASLQRFTARP